jgi:autotransporter-associated beta strand protein
MSTGADNTDSIFSGAFSGSGGLTKDGTGTLTLSGINTATGPLTIDSGKVIILGSYAGSVILNGGTVQYGPTPAAVPEPATIVLIALGIAVWAIARRTNDVAASPQIRYAGNSRNAS